MGDLMKIFFGVLMISALLGADSDTKKKRKSSKKKSKKTSSKKIK